jgi:hypothetical protein
MESVRGLVGVGSNYPEKVIEGTHALLAETAKDQRLRRASRWIVSEIM